MLYMLYMLVICYYICYVRAGQKHGVICHIVIFFFYLFDYIGGTPVGSSDGSSISQGICSPTSESLSFSPSISIELSK